jgi:adenylate cyclase
LLKKGSRRTDIFFKLERNVVAVTTAFMIFQFGDFVLDVERGQLRAGACEIELRPKSFEVLRYLVENGDRLVGKEEIIKRVWPKVVVTDESLTQCVSEIRQAIDDRDQSKIKTVPRRGYRFVASIMPRVVDSAVALAPVSRSTNEKSRQLGDGPSIAVMPFANLSGDSKQDYFSDGVTDDVITELSRFSELLVIARNSTFQYKGQPVDVRRVGQDLGVRYVLEGGVRRAGSRIRVTAQLIDAATGAHRWADRYDREIRDDFTVQDELARSIVTLLAARVTEAETERTLLKPPAAWQAYDYYLRGAETFRLALSGQTRELIHRARELLRESLKIDPNYARAYAMLARTQTHSYIEPIDEDYLNVAALDCAHELARKAVKLDSNLPESHSAFAWVLMFLRQHDAAIAEFERAISLNRNFNDHGYGLALVYACQPANAVQVLRANLRVDPFQYRRFAVMGHAHFMLGQYEQAASLLREAAACVPSLRIAHLWLAAAYGQLARWTEARAAAADVLRIEPHFTIQEWGCTAVYKNPEDSERLYDGLRKAGLPLG